MPRVCMYYDEVFRLHEPPYGSHPESPERLAIALESLAKTGLYTLVHIQPAPRRGLERDRILEVHDPAYVEKVEELAGRGGGYIDPDTYVGKYTILAAHAYTASVLDAVDKLVEGDCNIAIVLGRPPGHHAGRRGVAMGAPTLGFCIFNISALAAKHAANRGENVLVVDFDLHHGNGTQDILYSDERIVHLDLHQDPSTIYPGTGWPWENGSGRARGTKLNVIVPVDAGDDVYMMLFQRGLELAQAVQGSPSLVIVDAGFDAYAGDGFGMLYLTTNTYYELGTTLRRMRTRILVVLEGGYSIGLRRALPAFIAGLLGEANPYPEKRSESRDAVWRTALENFERLEKAIAEAKRNAGRF
ncbi:histone deacetylase family protein [Hyperthermus butylicus]|uniref:Histone deacetylase n=1 Tax=Hyperthermus butylicus (strain DSM 5456 / JCM 9403 / PLM1-5) TaxID=415426 RepID=A2BL29_HYPBU|nr:histone deacetylase family protein [Hyperthermus butylicus]ABM80690.1 putative Histone deacetylase [Hyperthermus butylicus DSM 5456]